MIAKPARALETHMTTTLDADIISKAAHIAKAATHIAALIDNHETISRATLNAAMTRAFGVSDSSGAWSQRDSFEMLEQALVLSLLKRDPLLGSGPIKILA